MRSLTVSAIAFQHHSLDAVLGLDLLRKRLGWGFVVGVVDGYVRPFGGELAGDFCSQSSVELSVPLTVEAGNSSAWLHVVEQRSSKSEERHGHTLSHL